MPSSAAPSVPSGNFLRRFRRNRSASAAVEFALVAPVFFGLLFAIIETAMMFFASQVLETMTQDSARMLLTGQAQSGQVGTCADPVSGAALPCTQATFKNFVCSQIPALFTCANLYVDVEAYPSGFSSIAFSTQIDGGKNFINNMQYNPGQPGEVVVVRLFYQWPQIVTGLGYNITNLTGNMRLLSATAVFQNEPY